MCGKQWQNASFEVPNSRTSFGFDNAAHQSGGRRLANVGGGWGNKDGNLEKAPVGKHADPAVRRRDEIGE
jgi:hypothetical protein